MYHDKYIIVINKTRKPFNKSMILSYHEDFKIFNTEDSTVNIIKNILKGDASWQYGDLETMTKRLKLFIKCRNQTKILNSSRPYLLRVSKYLKLNKSEIINAKILLKTELAENKKFKTGLTK